jgi:hypothetical protein
MGFRSTLKKVAMFSFAVMAISYVTKDGMPSPEFYGTDIPPPLQTKSDRKPFSIEVENERYHITPLYEYELEGVVVSTHHSDAFLDLAHEAWQDYLNIADICIIWGDNVKNGVYQDMTFENGNWTCYYSWPNAYVRQRFKESQLSNNHLLTEDTLLSQKILDTQPGDHIYIKGSLVTYANASNHFKRGTSTSRTDRGQGACEVIYVDTFEFIQKANRFKRILFEISKSIFIFSLFLLLLLHFTSNRHRPYAHEK